MQVKWDKFVWFVELGCYRNDVKNIERFLKLFITQLAMRKSFRLVLFSPLFSLSLSAHDDVKPFTIFLASSWHLQWADTDTHCMSHRSINFCLRFTFNRVSHLRCHHFHRFKWYKSGKKMFVRKTFLLSIFSFIVVWMVFHSWP